MTLFSQAYVLIRYPTFINFPTHAGTKLRTSSVLKSYKYLCTTYSVLIHKRCEWKIQSPKKRKPCMYSMILRKNIENYDFFLLTLWWAIYFFCFLSFSTYTKNSGLLIFIKIPKATFISYPTFIDFDQNSQGYVYFIPYVYWFWPKFPRLRLSFYLHFL